MLPGLPKHAQQYADDFEDTGRVYKLDPYILSAICARESDFGRELTPPDPSGTGDGGHGRGLMQIDDRAWPEFCASEAWKSAPQNIAFAGRILKQNMLTFAWDTFLAVAAYNCGPGRVKKALKSCGRLPVAQRNHIIDSYTTGRDYAAWVLSKRDSYLKAAVKQAEQRS